MNINQDILNGVCVLMLQGRLDAASAPQLRKQLIVAASLDSGMVLDLSAVNFMDSSGLGVLIASARWMRSLKSDLRLARMDDRVRRIFQLTHADQIFDIFDDLEAATDSFHWENSS